MSKLTESWARTLVREKLRRLLTAQIMLLFGGRIVPTIGAAIAQLAYTIV